MFFVLTKYKTAENHASLAEFLRAIWEAVSEDRVLSLAWIKVSSTLTIDRLLTISVYTNDKNNYVIENRLSGVRRTIL